MPKYNSLNSLTDCLCIDTLSWLYNQQEELCLNSLTDCLCIDTEKLDVPQAEAISS